MLLLVTRYRQHMKKGNKIKKKSATNKNRKRKHIARYTFKQIHLAKVKLFKKSEIRLLTPEFTSQQKGFFYY